MQLLKMNQSRSIVLLSPSVTGLVISSLLTTPILGGNHFVSFDWNGIIEMDCINA